jgi:hypothetical protein
MEKVTIHHVDDAKGDIKVAIQHAREALDQIGADRYGVDNYSATQSDLGAGKV